MTVNYFFNVIFLSFGVVLVLFLLVVPLFTNTIIIIAIAKIISGANSMMILTSFGDIKNLLSKMIFCNKINAIRQKICYNHISITGSDFLERRPQNV